MIDLDAMTDEAVLKKEADEFEAAVKTSPQFIQGSSRYRLEKLLWIIIRLLLQLGAMPPRWRAKTKEAEDG